MFLNSLFGCQLFLLLFLHIALLFSVKAFKKRENWQLEGLIVLSAAKRVNIELNIYDINF